MATRGDIKTRARRKADMESSPFIGTTEENDLFNEAYREVYALFAKNGLHMLKSSHSPTINGAATYTLPADFLAVIHVFRVEGGTFYELHKVEEDQFGNILSLTGNEADFYEILRTATNGRTIRFFPNPASGTYTVYYIPECPTLAADGDAVITFSNSDALLTCLLAKKFLAKENSSNDEVNAEFNRLYMEIQKEAQEVEMTQPGRVQDVRAMREYDPFRFRIYHGND